MSGRDPRVPETIEGVGPLKSPPPRLGGRQELLKAVLMFKGGGVVAEEVPPPGLEAGDILVEMKICGLCGTDVEKMEGRYTASPPIIGHEAAGVVAGVGELVEGFKVGDRVFPHHHVPCHECYFCKHGSETMCVQYRASNLDPGGFAEYFRVPAWNIQQGGVLKLPEGLSFEEASFIEPVACCLRGLKRLHVSEHDTALIVGAGPMGLLHLQLLTMTKAQVLLSEISPRRLALAEKLGAFRGYDAGGIDVVQAVKEATGGRGADLVITASGSPKAIAQAFRCVRNGGKLCLFGLPPKGSVLDYDLSDIFNREISVIPSYAATESETRAALRLIEERKLNVIPLITHRFRLQDFEDAVRAAKTQECVKAIIIP